MNSSTTKTPINHTTHTARSAQSKPLTDRDLIEKCKEFGKNARIFSRKFGFLLPEVFKRGLHRKCKCESIHHFAAKFAGMSHDVVNRIMLIHEKLKNQPLLWNQFEKYGWTKLQMIANVSTPETEKFWLEKINLPRLALIKYIKMWKIRQTVRISTSYPNCFVSKSNTLFSQTILDKPKNGGALEFETEKIENENARANEIQTETETSAKTPTERLTEPSTEPSTERLNEPSLERSTKEAANFSFKPTLPRKTFRKLKFNVDAETELELRKFKQKLERQKKQSVTLGETLKELLKQVNRPQSTESAPTRNAQENSKKRSKARPQQGLKPSPTRNKSSHKQQKREQTKVEPTKKQIHHCELSQKHTKTLTIKTKKFITQLHNGKCANQTCNQPATEIHHKIPIATHKFRLDLNRRGGFGSSRNALHIHDPKNLIPLCKTCHQLAHASDNTIDKKVQEHWGP